MFKFPSVKLLSKIFAFLLLLLALHLESYGQPTHLKSIKPLYKFVDSTDTKEKIGRNLKVLWLDSMIELRRTVNLNYNLQETRKWRKDNSLKSIRGRSKQ